MTERRLPLLITVRPEGLWDRRMSNDHSVDLRRELTRQRTAHGPALVLVDLAAMPIQQQKTIGHLRSDLAATYLPDDRVALVTTSALMHMQLKRVDLPSHARTFEDDAEARTWLEEG